MKQEPDTFTGRRQGLFLVRSALLAAARHKQLQAEMRRLALFRLRCAIAEVRDLTEIVEFQHTLNRADW